MSRWEPAMAQARAEAALAPAHRDVPIGALVLDPLGSIVARAHNERELTADPTAHAEVLALRRAASASGSWRLRDHTLITTLEPCTMCAGAAVLALVHRIVFGAYDPKAGAIASLWDVVRDPRLNHQPVVVGGIEAEACGAILSDFFADHRK